jgi:hypothetical protein
VPSQPPDPTPPLDAFLRQFWPDREAETVRPLGEYLLQFPGDDHGIAKEYWFLVNPTLKGGCYPSFSYVLGKTLRRELATSRN